MKEILLFCDFKGKSLPIFDVLVGEGYITNTVNIENLAQHVTPECKDKIIVFLNISSEKITKNTLEKLQASNCSSILIVGNYPKIFQILPEPSETCTIDYLPCPEDYQEQVLFKIKQYEKTLTYKHKQEKKLNKLKKQLHSLEVTTSTTEHKYNTLFNKSYDAKFIADTNGLIINSNRSASKLLGYTQKELSKKKLQDLLPDDQKGKADSAIQQLIEEGNFTMKTCVYSKNGKRLLVEISGVVVNLSKSTIIQIIVKDVTKETEYFRDLLSKNRAIEATNEGILITDPNQPDNPIIYANPTFIKKTGYARRDVIGKSFDFLFGADTNTQTIQQIRQAITSSKPIKREILNYKKDGSPFWNLFSITPIFDENKKTVNFIGIVNDVTKHKQTVQQLEEYKKFFTMGTDMLCIAGLDGYIKKTNPVFSKTLGFSEKELLSKPFIEFVHPDDHDKTNKEVAKLAKGKLTLSFENRYVTKSGNYRLLKWNVKPDIKTGKLYATARDITEEKLISTTLKGLNTSQTLAHIGYWEWNIPKNKSVIWSNEQYKIYGFNQGEKISLSKFTNRIHPEDRDKILNQNWQASPPETTKSTEYRILHPEKGLRYIHSLAQGIASSDGTVYKVVGTDQDITKRKKAEIKLQESQQRWLSLFNNSNDIVQILDRDFTVLDINHMPQNLLNRGITGKQYLGSHYFDYVLNGREIKTKVIAALRKNSNAHFDREDEQADSSNYYFKCNLVPLMSEKGTEGYIVIETDVSDEKRNEKQLIESENKLNKAIVTAPIPIMIHDEDGKVYRISMGWKKYSGYTIEKIPTISEWTKKAFGTEQRVSKKYVDNLFTYNETINNGEQALKDSKGRKRIWNFFSTPLGYMENGKRLILSTAVDLTKSKSAENEIRRLNKNLEKKVLERTSELEEAFQNIKKTQSQLIQQEKMASLGLLTAGLAHEINNPMNFIYAGINNLERIINDVQPIINKYLKLKPGENHSEAIETINQEKNNTAFLEKINVIPELLSDIKLGAERATEVVKGLRTFSRLDQNEKKPYDIHEGLDSSIMLLQNKVTDKITIIKKYDTGIGLIKCFPSQLNQVFLNIISNAIEALEGKGRITIQTSIPYGKVVISIKDNGVGMNKKTKNRIFDPFYTTKEVGKGVGLGLSISYGIIEKHGGEILVISTPKQGTEFRIKLPLE